MQETLTTEKYQITTATEEHLKILREKIQAKIKIQDFISGLT